MKIELSPDDLGPLVEQVVLRVLAQLNQNARPDDGRICYSEAEAATQLGLQRHQLRDERLRGRIASTKVMGGRVRYLPQDLTEYLNSRRQPATTT